VSILLELAKALSRIDGKIDCLYQELGPLANQIGKDARAVEFDKALLYELQRTCKNPTPVMLAETGIVVADRRSKEMYAAGDRHPNVVAMQEARETLPKLGSKEKIREARRKFVNHEEQDSLKLRASKSVKGALGTQVAEIQSMMQRALRYGENLEALRMELELGIHQKVDGILREKFENLEGQEIGRLKTLSQRVKEIESSIESQQKELEAHQKVISEKITSAQENFKGYEKRMQGVLEKAMQNLAETYADMDKKFDGIMASRKSDSMEMLEALRGKQKKFLEETYKNVQQEGRNIAESIEGAVEKLEGEHKVLKDLEDKCKKSIIDVEKTVARIGNILPKPRSRIRNG
jgi:ElaB/YqjD/DUF883 family membrane-anchored ribosome-binding protein